MEGLERRNTKKEYSVQFKLDAIQFMLETGASYTETAVQFKLSTSSIVKLWMKKFRKQGKEGLELKQKGVKEKLAGLSPVEYRTQSSQSAA
nr:transposase [Virgibacillus salarius]